MFLSVGRKSRLNNITTTTTTKIFCRRAVFLTQRRRSLSSPAAVVPLRENDDDSSSTTTTDHQHLSSSLRPRLTELRRKLQENPRSVTQVRQDLLQKKEKERDVQQHDSNASDNTSTMQLVYKLRQLYNEQHPVNNILTDSFHRQHSYLRLSLVEKCNLRCLYCMPEEGIPNPTSQSLLLTTPEILQLAALFIQHGVNKIKLTGGEPLLRKDICELIHGLSKYYPKLQQIGMTTNGILLSNKLDDLIYAGLSHVNISLDTLCQDKFTQLTRRKGLSRVLDSIEQACQKMPAPGRIKLNVVVMKDINTDELTDFCELTTQLPIDIRFIEWMPFNDNGWNHDKFVSYKDMLEIIQRDNMKLQRIQDGPNDTTKWYKIMNGDSSSFGRIGFITSMSQHFCGTCNRLRLTADGNIKVCLFGQEEISLRNVLRQQECNMSDVSNIIHYALSRKHYKLGGHSDAQTIANHSDSNRPMTTIGG